MEFILHLFKKIIPKPIFNLFQPAYHYLLAYIGALIYGFPSKDLIVIGVTGTKGKTTTSNLIHHILNSSGHKTGLSTTVNFKIGNREWKNNLKQTMPGRFHLQKMLRQMVKEGCKYAVIETSSEGILQFRHRFIDYDIAVFLNLSPEHLDRHKGFENYRAAKVELFKKVSQKSYGIAVYNFDDENLAHFLKPDVTRKIAYSISKSVQDISDSNHKNIEFLVELKNIKLLSDRTEFEANGIKFQTSLIGEFNVYNSAAAIAVAISQGVAPEKIQKGLSDFKTLSGRMEVIKAKQGFSVIVDYAHEPSSLESIYRAVRETQIGKKTGKMICVLGSAGGGRDKWKRPVMGKIAATYCDEIILTNEDPYDEVPTQILSEIKSGISNTQFPISKVIEIIDRREAIKKALSLAKKGDAVVLTGKGGEVWMCVENNKKIPWDEKKIVEEEIGNLPPF